MTSRERLIKTLNHEHVEKPVVDIGSTMVTGISAMGLTKLLKALSIYNEPVKISDPLQLLGKVEDVVIAKLDVDVVGVMGRYNGFGFRNENYKPWKLQDETPVKVPGKFNTTVDEEGNTFLYPKGNMDAKPSGKLPKGGYYFDGLIRQAPVDYSNLTPKEDFKDDYSVITDEELDYITNQVNYYYENTEYGINLGGFVASLGDFAPLPGLSQENPQGIRNHEEWMMAHYLYPDYVHQVFEMHTEVALENLKRLYQATGDRAQVIQISATDFGTQTGELMSPDTFRTFYKPCFTKLNNWVHENTNWKTFYHCCGSITKLLDDFVEMSVDVLNPVQTSAKGMDAQWLKDTYGDKLTFWGGGVDTQKTLPFSTPQEVKNEVIERLNIFNKNGGYVFNPVHNIQGNTPIENMLAMFEGIAEYSELNRRK